MGLTQTHWILNLNESFELIRYRGVSLVSNDFYICSVDNIWWVPAVINTKWFQLKPNFAFYSEVEPSLIILNGFFFRKLAHKVYFNQEQNRTLHIVISLSEVSSP